MKVGSLIECVEVLCPKELDMYSELPKKGSIYVVRGLYEYEGHLCVYIDEIINPSYDHYGRSLEIPYPAKWFREIQPPMTINIEELISEPQTLEHATF